MKHKIWNIIIRLITKNKLKTHLKSVMNYLVYFALIIKEVRKDYLKSIINY